MSSEQAGNKRVGDVPKLALQVAVRDLLNSRQIRLMKRRLEADGELFREQLVEDCD